MSVSRTKELVEKYQSMYPMQTGPEELAGQINRTGQRIASYGAQPIRQEPQGKSIFERGMSIVGRGFDILSRGQYAVAEAVESAVEGESAAGVIGGFGSGLIGRSKTSFSDVLEKAGVDNKYVRGIGGFALDVALDPTTYIGTGVLKNVSEEALATAAGRGFKEATRTAGARHRFFNLGNQARKEAKQIAEATGEKSTKALTEGAARQAEKDFRLDKAYEAQDVLKQTKGALQFKFAGKKFAESKGLYNLGERVSERASQNQTLDSLNKLFNPTATLKGRTLQSGTVHQAWRRLQGMGLQQLEKESKTEIYKAFKGLTQAEKRRITYAIEDGVDFGGELSKKGLSLQAAKDKAIELRDNYAAEDMSFGEYTGKAIMNPDKRVSNYVYHVLRGGKKEERQAWKNARRAEIDKLSKKELAARGIKTTAGTDTEIAVKSSFTIREAKAKGLKPVEAIDDILHSRLSKSYEQRAKYRFSQFIRDEFGVGDLPNDVAKQLGLVKANNNYLGKSTSYIPGNIYLPEEINHTLKKVDEFFTSNEATSEFVRYFDKVQNFWKFGATVVNPGHHIRNLIGDTFLNFLDGVKNPAVYGESLAIKFGKKGIKVGGVDLTPEDVLHLYSQSGSKAGFFHTEFAQDKNVVTNAIRAGAEHREDFVRMAHFIDSLKKNGSHIKPGTNQIIELNEAATKAGAAVRKYNIDYGDLTPFEQKYMKRAIPFYTFMRKNIPLQIEAMFMNPGRQAVVPKGLNMVEELLGVEGEGPEIEGLNTLPIWMRQAMSISIIGEGIGRNGVYWSPNVIPSFQIGELLETGEQGGYKGIISNILQNVSPIARAPFEIATGKELYSGRDIEAQGIGDIGQYLLNQLPAGRVLSRELNPEPGSAPIGEGQNPIIAAILRAGTGASGITLSELTPQRQQAALRSQQDPMDIQLQNLRANARQRALQQLYGNNIPPGLIQ